MTDTLLDVERLTKVFPVGKGGSLVAVNDVSFSIGRGETVGLVGESGSGKTTVGRCILRLIEPTSGRILFDGSDVVSLGHERLRQLRSRMQLVFQEHFASLNPRYSVRAHVEEPLILRGGLDGRQRRSRVAEVLDSVNLSRDRVDRFPSQLTAGEQQRVGIARAIVTRPDLIVLDEPTSSLDPSLRAEILALLRRLQDEYGTAYLFISHDLTAVEAISHRIAIMYLGRIVEISSTHQIIKKQLHPYSAALLSAVLYPDPLRRLDPFDLHGEIPSPINPRDECSLIGRCPFAQTRCGDFTPPLDEIEPSHWSACFRADEFRSRGVPRNGDRGDDPERAGPKLGPESEAAMRGA